MGITPSSQFNFDQDLKRYCSDTNSGNPLAMFSGGSSMNSLFSNCGCGWNGWGCGGWSGIWRGWSGQYTAYGPQSFYAKDSTTALETWNDASWSDIIGGNIKQMCGTPAGMMATGALGFGLLGAGLNAVNSIFQAGAANINGNATQGQKDLYS